MTGIKGMLIAQWEMQREAFNNDPTQMTTEEAIAFIHWNITALTDELHEVLGEIGWKPWATSRHINGEAAFKEMIDAWHFFMNILLALGPYVTDDMQQLAAKFQNAYFEKHEVNRKRQEEGYDGVSGKCKLCKRDLKEASTDLCGSPAGCPLYYTTQGESNG